MNRSSRLRNILNRRKDLWEDSETDTSLLSNNENNKKYETSSDENDEPTCCLICSILPNLSNINTCQKHLALVKKSINPTQVVYMMHPAINNCHCRSKSKHRYRSNSSSSSELRHHRKKRSMTVQSSDTESQGDLFFSPNIQSQENQPCRSNHIEARLSPSLPPSSKINTNINKNYLLTPVLIQNKSIDETNSPDIIEIDSDLSYSPRIPLNRIVHVKDEDEILNNNDQKKIMINMAQATEQMLNNEYPQPVILLKRISLEKYIR